MDNNQKKCDCEKEKKNPKTIGKKRSETFEDVVVNECGRRLCKCGKSGCEFATDFFDENGHPTVAFGNDEDLIANANLEAAEDFAGYARRVGMLGGYDYDGIAENGEALYHNTATYRMIDPSNESADAGKS